MSTDRGPVDTVGRFLDEARRGDAAALDRLLPLVYTELHAIAGRHLRRERPGNTLQPTALGDWPPLSSASSFAT